MDADRWTTELFLREFRGFQHAQRLLTNEQASQNELIDGLVKRIEALEQKSKEDAAKIGELMARIEAVESRVDKAAKLVADMKAKANGK